MRTPVQQDCLCRSSRICWPGLVPCFRRWRLQRKELAGQSLRGYDLNGVHTSDVLGAESNKGPTKPPSSVQLVSYRDGGCMTVVCAPIDGDTNSESGPPRTLLAWQDRVPTSQPQHKQQVRVAVTAAARRTTHVVINLHGGAPAAAEHPVPTPHPPPAKATARPHLTLGIVGRLPSLGQPLLMLFGVVPSSRLSLFAKLAKFLSSSSSSALSSKAPAWPASGSPPKSPIPASR